MSYIKIYVHAVWSTKDRVPLLADKVIRQAMWDHIRENAVQKGIFIDTINGYVDHCHCLISLGGDQSIRKIVQLIKGESSNWINQSGRLSGRFSWQKEFFASSVSVSRLPVVRKYLYDQEVHHQRISFQDEYREFIREAGFQDPGMIHE